MTFKYQTNEVLMALPGRVQKDESMNIVHFLNAEGLARRMIISRELLAEGETFESIVNTQVNALKQDKIMKVGEVKNLTVFKDQWAAIAIDARSAIGKNHAWQFHVALHWQEKYLLTISLNSEEEMLQPEKDDWLKRIEALEFSDQ